MIRRLWHWWTTRPRPDYALRFAWLREHEIGTPTPWWKRWFAEVEWRIRKRAKDFL